MTDYWIIPTQVFDGSALHSDAALWISQGKVAEVGRASDVPSGALTERIDGIVSPGFVDLQVNGGGGVLLNETPTARGMQAIAAAHRSVGTVAILPTVITDAPDVLEAAVDAAIEAKGSAGIAGLHIEGPHISIARRGTHAAKFVRPFDDTTLALVGRLRMHDVSVMLTLAPEAATCPQISALRDMGVIVSIGHSDADARATHAAVTAGANCFTHLFNAMSPMLNRSAGVVGAAINSDAYCGVICDGHHVADEMLALAIRARPVPDRMFLVSDAMPTVAGPDNFELYGQTLALKNGKLVNSEGSLAGAHVTQLHGVMRLVSHVGLSMVEALRMAVTIPAQVIGLSDLATLVGRDVTDVIVLGNDLSRLHPLPTPSALAS